MDQDKRQRLLRELAMAARRMVVPGSKSQGYCGDWSYVFVKLTKLYGFRPKLISGYFRNRGTGNEPHYWVTINGVIYDGTADQFFILGKNKKVVRPYKFFTSDLHDSSKHYVEDCREEYLSDHIGLYSRNQLNSKIRSWMARKGLKTTVKRIKA